MAEVERLAKQGYVAALRRLRGAARAFGLAGEARPPGALILGHWARSLLAIHDLDEMIGLGVPWWTYRAISAVEEALAARPQARVFEWGSGASTFWLAARAAGVASVEHDRAWHALMQARLAAAPQLAGRVRLDLVEPGGLAAPGDPFGSEKSGRIGRSFEAYARRIEATGGPYDLIVIDGRARSACLRLAQAHLAEGGLIVFDNAHRARYRAAIAQSGLAVRRMRGLAPALPYPDETAILTRPVAAP